MWPCESLPASGGFASREAGTPSLGNAVMKEEGYRGLERNSSGGLMQQDQAETVAPQAAGGDLEAKDENAAVGQLAASLPADGEQEDIERKQGGHACIEDGKQNVEAAASHAEVKCYAPGPGDMHNEATEKSAPENNAVRKRVRWRDEGRVGPLAAAEDGSPYMERGLGLTAGGQRWTKKRVRRLSVEGVRGSRYKHRLKGRRGTIGFGREEEAASRATSGGAHGKWGLGKVDGDDETGGRAHGKQHLHNTTRFRDEATLDADALLERQAIVESVRELRARVSQRGAESAAKSGGELSGGWGKGSPQGGEMLRRGASLPTGWGNHILEISAKLSENTGRDGAKSDIAGGERRIDRGDLLKAGSPDAKLWKWPAEDAGPATVWGSTYREMGSGFGAIQLNARGAEGDGLGRQREGDRGQEGNGQWALGGQQASSEGHPAQTGKELHVTLAKVQRTSCVGFRKCIHVSVNLAKPNAFILH